MSNLRWITRDGKQVLQQGKEHIDIPEGSGCFTAGSMPYKVIWEDVSVIEENKEVKRREFWLTDYDINPNYDGTNGKYVGLSRKLVLYRNPLPDMSDSIHVVEIKDDEIVVSSKDICNAWKECREDIRHPPLSNMLTILGFKE